MSVYYHDILSKCDRALCAYLVAKGAGTAADVLPAKASMDKPLPVTVCWSEKGSEVAPYSATYLLQVSVMVKSQAGLDAGETAPAARLASGQRVAAAFSAFYADIDSAGDKLGADITTAARALAASDPAGNGDLAQVTVMNVRASGPEAGFEENGSAWVDTLNLEVLCCAGDVS